MYQQARCCRRPGCGSTSVPIGPALPCRIHHQALSSSPQAGPILARHPPAPPPPPLSLPAQVWFRGGPEVDAEIVSLFSPDCEALLAGQCDGWAAQPLGALAGIILGDQLFRWGRACSPGSQAVGRRQVLAWRAAAAVWAAAVACSTGGLVPPAWPTSWCAWSRGLREEQQLVCPEEGGACCQLGALFVGPLAVQECVPRHRQDVCR